MAVKAEAHAGQVAFRMFGSTVSAYPLAVNAASGAREVVSCSNRLRCHSTPQPALAVRILQVRGNLLPNEREKVLKRFSASCFKRTARVVMGEPPEDATWLGGVGGVRG